VALQNMKEWQVDGRLMAVQQRSCDTLVWQVDQAANI
jgi:hypothetical protein